MRRVRSDGPKVWHNPDVELPHIRARRGPAEEARAPGQNRGEGATAPHRRDERVSDAEGPPSAGDPQGTAPESGGRRVGRVVVTARVLDPKEAERERLLERLLTAEGRPRITSAADAYLAAGFTFPLHQDVQLQLLEHRDEAVIREAIEGWHQLLDDEEPKRRAVLESRIKRIQELADDAETKSAARRLFRLVTGRPDEADAQ
jgi:hypothetical protein